MTEARPHFPHLDGLRALAALWVVFSHALVEAYPMIYGQYVGGYVAMVGGWLNYAHFAVDFFIVLSGYCLMLPLAEGSKRFSTRRFIWGRARRILPPFYAALAICFVMDHTVISERTGTIWDLSLPATGKAALANIVLMQDILCIFRINSVFWSIAVEWKIYFLFPILLLGWRRIGATATTLIAIGVGYVGGFLLWHTAWEGATVYYVALFACGMFAAYLAVRPQPLRIRRLMLGISIVISSLIGFICHRMGIQWAGTHFIYLDGPVGIAAATLLLYLQVPSRLRSAISWKPLAFVGPFAYSLYLIHLPLLQVAWELFVMPFNISRNGAFLVMACSVPAIIWFAYMFFIVFERPFLASAQKRALE